MTGSDFLENINNIDDDLISEAENWVRPKARKMRILVEAANAAACLCLVIGLALGYTKEKNLSIDNGVLCGCVLLPGADEIYPTVMVNGELYEWLLGRALIDELPVGSVYCGKIYHTSKATPENDCEFASVFSVSGRIFTDPDKDLVYLELTTDWLENQIVIFEPISVSERYRYHNGEHTAAD